MREGTCAVRRIMCPVYTETGMSRPVLEEFFDRKMNENPFSCSMQKYTQYVQYMYCIVTVLLCILYCDCF